MLLEIAWWVVLWVVINLMISLQMPPAPLRRIPTSRALVYAALFTAPVVGSALIVALSRHLR